MTRRQELENIIIGTLLDSTEDHNFFMDCRSTITADMFLDDTNRRIYEIITEMNSWDQQKTDPVSIWELYGSKVADILPRMCELVNEWSFIYKKFYHQEYVWLNNTFNGCHMKKKDVSFPEYVNHFIKLVLR